MERGTFRTVEMTDVDLRDGGRVDATVFSVALGRRADCSFWIPQVARPSLPLVVLLHGVYGGHWAWIGRGGAARTATKLIAGGEIEPCILAMPSDGLIGHGSGYVRQPGADVPAWVLDEVPALAAMVSPSVDPQAPLALVGLSMGGFGALRLATAYGASRVAAAVGMSSITALDQMALFGVDPLPAIDDPRDRSVVESLEHGNGVPGPLSIVCGTDDPLIEHNRELHTALTSRHIDHEWLEDDGGHDWTYWRSHLPTALRFVAPYLMRA